MPLVASETPAFAPGSRFQYSNSGFLLLGRLIERASGQSYAEYLATHVFGPAGMVQTGLDPAPIPLQAAGMTAMHGPLRPAAEAALHGNPAGGGYSTAADLQRFFAALLGGKLTGAAMLAKLTSPQIVAAPASASAPKHDCGMGFGVGVFDGHRWFGDNGGAPGVTVEATVFPDDGTTVIVLSNRDPPTGSILFREVRKMLFDPDAIKSCNR